MLNGRIYRAACLPMLVAVVVASLSLGHRPAPLSTTLAPEAFDGVRASQTLQTLAREFPNRRAGGIGDDQLAQRVAHALEADGGGFQVDVRRFTGRTAAGRRALTTVVAQRPGNGSGSPVVLLAHRDAVAGADVDGLSATAVLLELARVLASREMSRTIILVSSSGGASGAAGAAEFASISPRPIDAAIVLGSLGSRGARVPSVVPFSNEMGGASLRLVRTVSSAIGKEYAAEPLGPGLISQFMHLALPLGLGEQSVLNAAGIPAVLVQTDGEGESVAGSLGPARLQHAGRAVLAAVDALDRGPDVSAAPQSSLVWAHQTLPSWAIRLLVGALLLPVLLVAIDALARVRRRREPLARWMVWAVSCAGPLLSCLILAVLLARAGLVTVGPPAAVSGRSVSLDGGVVATLVVLGLLFIAAWVLLRRSWRALGVRGHLDAPAAGVAALLVLVLGVVVLWVFNPFAALLLVAATHLWLPLARGEARPGYLVSIVLLALGLIGPVSLIVFYAGALHTGPISGVWIVLLLFTGGHLSIFAAALIAVLFGACCAFVLLALQRRQKTTVPPQVTIRGPVSYAGPGSLGGTESALRR